MRFLRSLLGKTDDTINSYDDFWKWFQSQEKSFFRVVRQETKIEEQFFRKLQPKLARLNDGFYYLTGMLDEKTAELIITADGNIRNIVFVEELVAAAPQIEGWKFTALKPPLDIKDVSISMDGYTFGGETLFFAPNVHMAFPDEIDITIVHDAFNEANKNTIVNGVYIFLDNYIGELDAAITIDNVNVTGSAQALPELIPISKLKAYLSWRQKEFIEKYEGVHEVSDQANYSVMKAELDNGNMVIAAINTDLLKWDQKASHPWILNVAIKYDGKDNGGMPDEKTYEQLDQIENTILDQLKDHEGYLNIGRQTSENVREIYFACRDFRKPSKVLHQLVGSSSSGLEVSYDIYKDKYWRSFERFDVN